MMGAIDPLDWCGAFSGGLGPFRDGTGVTVEEGVVGWVESASEEA